MGEPAITGANLADLDEVCELFREVSEAMEGTHDDALWRWGIHPSEEMLRGYVQAGQLFIARKEGVLVGALVMNDEDVDGFVQGRWPSGLGSEGQAVLHLLCVKPGMRRGGIARNLLQHAIAQARAGGARVVRLDVVPNNLSAKALYAALGFIDAGRAELFYEDTGYMEFDLMELVL